MVEGFGLRGISNDLRPGCRHSLGFRAVENERIEACDGLQEVGAEMLPN